MGHQAEFDLSQELKNWRKTLKDSNTISVEAIQELEDHLLDEVEHLIEKKLSEEEAFWVAQKRLGNPHILVKEYRKIERMPLQVWLRTVVGGAAMIFGMCSLIYSMSFVSSILVHAFVTTCSAAVFILLLGVGIAFFALVWNSISIEKLKDVLESHLIDHTLLVVGFALITKFMERLVSFLMIDIVSIEYFGYATSTAQILAISIVMIAILSTILILENKKDKPKTEFV